MAGDLARRQRAQPVARRQPGEQRPGGCRRHQVGGPGQPEPGQRLPDQHGVAPVVPGECGARRGALLALPGEGERVGPPHRRRDPPGTDPGARWSSCAVASFCSASVGRPSQPSTWTSPERDHRRPQGVRDDVVGGNPVTRPAAAPSSNGVAASAPVPASTVTHRAVRPCRTETTSDGTSARPEPFSAAGTVQRGRSPAAVQALLPPHAPRTDGDLPPQVRAGLSGCERHLVRGFGPAPRARAGRHRSGVLTCSSGRRPAPTGVRQAQLTAPSGGTAREPARAAASAAAAAGPALPGTGHRASVDLDVFAGVSEGERASLAVPDRVRDLVRRDVHHQPQSPPAGSRSTAGSARPAARGRTTSTSPWSRIPPKPATSAIQAPASEAMCSPSRVCSQVAQVHQRRLARSSRRPGRGGRPRRRRTAWVQADSDESRTVQRS